MKRIFTRKNPLEKREKSEQEHQIESTMKSQNYKNIGIDFSGFVGRKKREEKGRYEDYIEIDTDNNIFLVSDGLGGHGNGDYASYFVSKALQKRLESLMNGVYEGISYDVETIEKKLIDAVKFTNEQVIYPMSYYSRDLKDFGATLALLYYKDPNAYIINVGDSRIYLHRENNLELLTSDDRKKNESGFKPSKGLTQYLGMKEINIHSRTVNINPEDSFLITTDGLTDSINDDEILEIFNKCKFEDIRHNLIKKVDRIEEEYKGADDDISFILLKY